MRTAETVVLLQFSIWRAAVRTPRIYVADSSTRELYGEAK
jgi:hypothetical protein